MTCLFVASLSPDLQAETAHHDLTVYAGPQSVSPLEIIYVTLEATTTVKGRTLVNQEVELSYLVDGILKTLSGNMVHGLISFDVPAQETTGLMKFSAKISDVTSNEALISVVAGRPQKFSLNIKAGEKVATVNMASGVLTDLYNNPVSDLSLLSIDWIDSDGLIAHQSVQPMNGQVLVTAKCPAKFSSPLKIRAAFNTVQFLSRDISSLCFAEKS